MPGPRLPPALEVFPTLQRFRAVLPRRLSEIPIGCAARNSVETRHLQESVLHLYHDLGVLSFAGCSAAQARRIGDILQQVVAWGGPGALVSRLDEWRQESVRHREKHLEENNIHDAVSKDRVSRKGMKGVAVSGGWFLFGLGADIFKPPGWSCQTRGYPRTCSATVQRSNEDQDTRGEP